MGKTSVECPVCHNLTDECPCWCCGYIFCEDEETHKGED